VSRPAADVEVACRPLGDGWICDVTVDESGSQSYHEIGVARADLERLIPGATAPDALVRQSFAFLLEREPKESILPRFELPVIGRYFPEWEAEIRRGARSS
jgi:hypothetical protein